MNSLERIYNSIILERFIDMGLAYFINKYNDIIKVETHIHGIIDYYDLESSIKSNFKQDFGIRIDWDKDWDTVVEYVKDYMEKEEIFFVVVDLKNKQVFVRKNLGRVPHPRQMKALSDWAIEQGYNEEIIVDDVWQ